MYFYYCILIFFICTIYTWAESIYSFPSVTLTKACFRDSSFVHTVTLTQVCWLQLFVLTVNCFFVVAVVELSQLVSVSYLVHSCEATLNKVSPACNVSTEFIVVLELSNKMLFCQQMSTFNVIHSVPSPLCQDGAANTGTLLCILISTAVHIGHLLIR